MIDWPNLLNTDPYGEAWLIKVRPGKAEDLEKLLDAYKALLG